MTDLIELTALYRVRKNAGRHCGRARARLSDDRRRRISERSRVPAGHGGAVRSHEARFHSFGAIATAVEERIRAELAAMGTFITGSAVTVRRVDRMTRLTERRAGWVRKPLHDR
jgi:hypothetical protein